MLKAGCESYPNAQINFKNFEDDEDSQNCETPKPKINFKNQT